MTEYEWLTTTDPEAMLEFLDTGGEPKDTGQMLYGYPVKASQPHAAWTERKLRLFACGCCRQEWAQMDQHSRDAVQVAEQLADGEATEEERRQFHDTERHPQWAAKSCCFAIAADAARWTSSRLQAPASEIQVAPSVQTAVLREIMGNPFKPLQIKWAWFGSGELPTLWSDRTESQSKAKGYWRPEWAQDVHVWLAAVQMAEAMYRSRDFTGMPVLGDALEECGCQDEAILRHCRGYRRCVGCRERTVPSCVCEGTGWRVMEWHPAIGPRVRGCHVVDALTGRE